MLSSIPPSCSTALSSIATTAAVAAMTPLLQWHHSNNSSDAKMWLHDWHTDAVNSLILQDITLITSQSQQLRKADSMDRKECTKSIEDVVWYLQRQVVSEWMFFSGYRLTQVVLWNKGSFKWSVSDIRCNHFSDSVLVARTKEGCSSPCHRPQVPRWSDH